MGTTREPEPIAQPHSLEVRNPATGEIVRSVAITEAGEVDQKVARARPRNRHGRARPCTERAAALRAFRDLLEQELEECAQITTSEVGKPIRQSRNEIRAVLERIDWNIADVDAVTAPRTITSADALEERVTYEPVGVVAHVSVWNTPTSSGSTRSFPRCSPAMPCVTSPPSTPRSRACGSSISCTGRVFPSTSCMRSWVPAPPAPHVDADVNMVCFTRSYTTGRRVARAVADRLVKVQLELGGKDAAYVCDDVDVDEAALAIAEGAFYNGGQSCSATERVVRARIDLGRVREGTRRRGRGVPSR